MFSLLSGGIFYNQSCYLCRRYILLPILPVCTSTSNETRKRFLKNSKKKRNFFTPYQISTYKFLITFSWGIFRMKRASSSNIRREVHCSNPDLVEQAVATGLFLAIRISKLEFVSDFEPYDFVLQKRNLILNKDLHKNYTFATDDFWLLLMYL
jgi:hypothetical protein